MWLNFKFPDVLSFDLLQNELPFTSTSGKSEKLFDNSYNKKTQN